MTLHRSTLLLALAGLVACADPEPQTPAAPTNLRVAEGKRGSRRTIHLRGNAEPGATVRVFEGTCGGAALAEGSAAEFGDPGFSLEVPENATAQLFAQAELAGRVSPCSEPVSYTHDGLAPDAPRLAAFEPPSPSAAMAAEVLLEAEAGVIVELFAEAGCGSPLGAVQVDDAGLARFPFAPAQNGSLEIHARAVDLVLNFSACAPLGTYVHDSIAPSRPTITEVSPPGSRTITQPLVAGTGEPGARIEVFLESSCTTPAASTSADASGRFEVTVAVPKNRISTFYLRAVDAAGNRSACGAAGAFTHDDVAPVRPTLTSTPTSPSNSVVQPSISGSAEKHTSIEVFDGAACAGAPVHVLTADAQGAFAFTLEAAANTRTEISARSVDAVGNVSPCSLPLVYEHDDVPPAPPTLSGTDPVSPSNSVFQPRVLGTAEPGAAITLYANASCTNRNGTGTADASGAFAVTGSVSANSPRTFWATATDAAGNASACSTDFVPYLYDTRAPATPEILSTLPPSPSTTRATAVVGTAEIESTIELFATPCTGAPLASAPVGDVWWGTSGHRLFEVPATGIASGTSEWWVRAVDAAGNASGCTGVPISFTHASAGWGPELSPGGGATGDVSAALALAGDGTVFAAWARIGVDERRLVVARQTSAGWSAPVELASRWVQGLPSIAADGQGRALVVWRESLPGADSEVRAATFVPSTGWTAPVVVASGSSSYGASMAMDEAGNALAVWDQRASGSATSDIFAARYTPAGGWESPELLEQLTVSLVDARISMEPGGNAIALFRSATGGSVTESLHAARYVPGSGWGPAELLTSDADEREYAAGIDASGTATVLWVETGFDHGLRATRSTSSGWSTSQLLASSSARNLRLAVDTGGSALTAFYEGNALKTARYATATGWSPPEVVSNDANLQYPHVALSGSDAIVTWHRSGGPLSFRRLTAQGWGTRQFLAGGGVGEHALVLRGGRVGVIWSAGSGGSLDDKLGARLFEP